MTGKRSTIKRGVAGGQLDSEKGEVNKLSKGLAAKESLGIKRNTTSRASGRKAEAEEKKSQATKASDPPNEVAAVAEKEEEFLASGSRRKRKGESEAAGTEAAKKSKSGAGVNKTDMKQNRRSNVAEVLASRSSNKREKKKVEAA